MTIRDLPAVAMPTKTGVQTDIAQTAVNRWNPGLSAEANEADDARSISMLDPIGANWMGEGVTAKRVAGALRNMGKGPVTALINSPGGDFFEGLAIYNLLREHDGAVTVKILGIAASAASAIAMAGDTVLIARAGFLMIHNTHVCACGDRHGLQEVADWMQPFDDALIDIYAARTGKDAKALATMLDKESWISGKAAIDQGFADDLLPANYVAASENDSAKARASTAQAKMDVLLARLNIPRSERRQMVADLKGTMPGAGSGGTPGAAEHDTQDAVIAQGAQALLAKLS